MPYILMLFLIILLVCLYNGLGYASVSYCASPDWDLAAAINKCERKINYWADQQYATQYDLKAIIDSGHNEGSEAFKLAKAAATESQTNLNSEQKMLRVLRTKLEAGQYDRPEVSSSLGKRKEN